MALPRPENDAENNDLLEFGETWLDVFVNGILDEDQEYGNWERRLRGYLKYNGRWQIAHAEDKREFYCVKKQRANSCESQINSDWLDSGKWQIASKSSRFSKMTISDLETLSFGSRVGVKCGLRRSKFFICLRDGHGGEFFAKCKNRSCSTFLRRRVKFNDDNFIC